MLSRALAYVAKSARKDGGIYDKGLANYTTSVAIMAFKEANTDGRYDTVLKNATAFLKKLQHDEPDDFVVATGESHTVREFVERAFGRVGLDWERYVAIDPRYFRPSEVDDLRGDASKARRVLGWTPRRTFSELVDLMVDADIQLLDDQLAGRLVVPDSD